MKKILILAPHQDDEIILCGSFMKRLIKKGHDIYIVFMTNGNYEPAVHTIRLKEALQVSSLYGLPENHVIFMGYANEYDVNEPHIYNAPNEMELHSQYGVGETYGLSTHPEYSFQKHSVHHKYTRKNLVRDLHEILDELRPDMIFATGEEIHPGHSANSLFLDEVLGEILNSDKNYRPIVLKKPEYSTAWFGLEDFSETENPPAIFDYKNPRVIVNGHRSWFYDPYLRWKDRLSILADDEAPAFVKKALELYASQNAIAHFNMLLNSDVVFWLRRTDSLTYEAQVSCSSGGSKFLHDFKRNDTTNLKRKKMDVWEQDASMWRPDCDDEFPFIRIDFNRKMPIKEVVIYQEFCPRCAVLDCRLEDDSGQEIWKGALEKKRATVVRDISIKTRSLIIKIEKCTDRSVYQPGITEVEVFSDDVSVDWLDYIRK